jgi:hypothetical protein
MCVSTHLPQNFVSGSETSVLLYSRIFELSDAEDSSKIED